MSKTKWTPADPEDQQAEDEAEQENADSEEEQAGEEESLDDMEREMLLNLLESLSPEDRNLPLQQALENAPATRHQQEW